MAQVHDRIRKTLWVSSVVWFMGLLAALQAGFAALQITMGSDLDLERLTQVISLDEVGDVTMTVGDLPLWLRALSAAPGIVTMAVLAAAAFQLLAIWQIGEVVSRLEYAMRASGHSYAVIFGTRLTIPWLPLALGIVAGAFRWVIRDGARLEKETEGVI